MATYNRPCRCKDTDHNEIFDDRYAAAQWLIDNGYSKLPLNTVVRRIDTAIYKQQVYLGLKWYNIDPTPQVNGPVFFKHDATTNQPRTTLTYEEDNSWEQQVKEANKEIHKARDENLFNSMGFSEILFKNMPLYVTRRDMPTPTSIKEYPIILYTPVNTFALPNIAEVAITLRRDFSRADLERILSTGEVDNENRVELSDEYRQILTAYCAQFAP
jgi:hypothetical protein